MPAHPPPQWYPDPEQPGTLRYWDGAAWTDQRAPMQQQASTDISTWKIVTGVAVGILAAIAAVWFVLQLTTFNDLGDEVDRSECVLEGGSDC